MKLMPRPSLRAHMSGGLDMGFCSQCSKSQQATSWVLVLVVLPPYHGWLRGKREPPAEKRGLMTTALDSNQRLVDRVGSGRETLGRGIDIHQLAKEGDFRCLRRLLLPYPTLVNRRDKYGMTPLHWAADAAVAQLLLSIGAEVNVRSDYGSTPLHRAAAKGDPPIIRLLLAHGADLNARDQSGRTPLHLAAAEGHSNATKLLVSKSTYLNVRDRNGLTPLGLALRRGHEEVACLLRQSHAQE